MEKDDIHQEPDINLLLPQLPDDKTPSIPLEFQYFPLEIISKQFTKLNSQHPYRVLYLGPRPLNTLALHKKYGINHSQDHLPDKSELANVIHFPKYRVNLRKITNCFLNAGKSSGGHYKSAIFYRAFQGMNPTIPLGKQYIFDSTFQSGNLDCVIKVKPTQFDLFLRIDSNTRGHTSWFFFSVKNGRKMDKITLNICNLTNPSSLYEQGMRPFVFSKKAWLKNKKSWSQDLPECTFQACDLRYQIVYESISIPSSYHLSFNYQFQEEQDQIFFAYCVPYTYSQLQKDIQTYCKSQFVKKASIGKSLSGLDLPILHITNHQYKQKKKKNIIVTGRVHPGQSNGSHVLKGFIQFLMQDSKEAIQLRSRCNFFIIPMLNPDGVVLGNTRSSISGKDLNRQFMSSNKEMYPQMYSVKSFTAKLQRKYGVLMFMDFHGHSRKKNTFLYGPNYPLSHQQYYKCRLLPKLIQKIDPRFRFYSCSFMISDQKKSTGRAVMLNQLKIPYSYTVQSSLGLFYHPQHMKTFPFQQPLWKEMGKSIANGTNSFVQTLLELQSLMRERKALRQKQKEQRLNTAAKVFKTGKEDRNSKDEKVNKEDQFQLLLKSKKGNFYLQLIQQMKLANNPKNFQEDVESDDHDEGQDMETYKLVQFTSLVVNQKKNYKKQIGRITQQRDQSNFDIPEIQIQDQQILIVEPPFSQKPRKSVSFKAQESARMSPKQSRIPAKKQFRRISQLKTNRLTQTKPVPQQPKKTVSQQKRVKNFVQQNKVRYTMLAKNLFPLEDRCEILALPKNIQAMRKEMTKGRSLLGNIQDTRRKTIAQAQSPSLDIQVSPINQRNNIHILPSSQRNSRERGSRPSSNQGLYQQQLSPQQFRFRKSMNYLHSNRQYLALKSMQIDNMAMTISTFRNHRK